jgi:hypothetical protein
MIGKQICTHFGKLNVTNLFAFETASLNLCFEHLVCPETKKAPLRAIIYIINL